MSGMKPTKRHDGRSAVPAQILYRTVQVSGILNVGGGGGNERVNQAKDDSMGLD
jgi:hypothetical protein